MKIFHDVIDVRSLTYIIYRNEQNGSNVIRCNAAVLSGKVKLWKALI